MGGKGAAGSYQQPAMTSQAIRVGDYMEGLAHLSQLVPQAPGTLIQKNPSGQGPRQNPAPGSEGEAQVQDRDPSMSGTKVDYDDPKDRGRSMGPSGGINIGSRAYGAKRGVSLLDEDTSPGSHGDPNLG